MKKITFLKRLDSLFGPFLARVIPASSPVNKTSSVVKRVLFIRPGGIGDAVLLVPAIRALIVRYPQAKIEVLAEKRNVGVFELCPQVEQVFCYDYWRDWPRFFSRKYDLIIDTEQWHYLSAVIARLLRAPIRCGFATNSRQKLFTHTVPYNHYSYEVDSFLSLLNALNGERILPPDPPYLTLTDDLRLRCDALLRPLAGHSYVVLFPGASIQERRWGSAAFKELAQCIYSRGLSVVVVGGVEDAEIGQHIITNLDLPHGLNLAGKSTLAETAAILQKAIMLVSADSGVLHLAAGVSCPSVSLFGPGIEAKWAPQGAQHTVVNLGLSCSPCTRFGTTPECEKQGQCIQDISVEMVWDQVEPLLAKRI